MSYHSNRCLCTLSTAVPCASDGALRIWARLSDSGLFPRASTKSTTSFATTSDLYSGLVGTVLAQQECVAGEYPFTTAFLDLIMACLR